MSTNPPIAAITPRASWRMPFTGPPIARRPAWRAGELGGGLASPRRVIRGDLDLPERGVDLVGEVDRLRLRDGHVRLVRVGVVQLLGLVDDDVAEVARVHAGEGGLGAVVGDVPGEHRSLGGRGRERVDGTRQLARSHRPAAAGYRSRHSHQGERKEEKPPPHRRRDTGVPSGGRRRLSLRAVAGIAQQLERRRAAVAEAWDLGDAVVLVEAGDEIPVPGRGDRTYPFRAHSEYLYLTDRERPGGVLAFDPGEGWIEFVKPVTAEELLWTGLEGDREGVPEGARPLDDLEDWLGDRPVRRLGATDDADEELRNELIRVRRPKDEVELERMRIAEEATRAGFAELVRLIGPGVTERDLQIALEATFLRSGGDFLAYESIVAAGDHSRRPALLPHVARAEGRRAPAGGRGRGVPRVASDVTRTYPWAASSTESSAWSGRRCAARARPAIAACRPGVEWREVHRTAALIIAEGLVELGVLSGAPEPCSRAAP